MAETRPSDDLDAATEVVLGANPVTIRRRVKWGECDPAGVVYMVNYGEYVVSAYEIFMRVLLNEKFVKAKVRHRIALPAKAFAIEFYASLRPDDDFVMTVEIVDIRAKTFDISVRGRSIEDHDLFLAKLTPIAVDRTKRTATSLPRAMVQKLRRYRETCALNEARAGTA
jgi:YbgC/YbaW family acyl-CoA thioester hydrolase